VSSQAIRLELARPRKHITFLYKIHQVVAKLIVTPLIRLRLYFLKSV